jgi:hypothetical protein
MNTQYKDTFFESVEKLVWYDTKLWKVWEFITRGLPNFFKNIWKFRKELYNHQWWDYHFTLEMLYRSLTIMVNKLELEGIEEDESRMKKVGKIHRALELIKHKYWWITTLLLKENTQPAYLREQSKLRKWNGKSYGRFSKELNFQRSLVGHMMGVI